MKCKKPNNLFLTNNSFKIPKRFNFTKNKNYYDVLIVGGGMVGASLACGIGQSSLSRNVKVGIIESSCTQNLSPLPPIPDLRVFSINKASIDFFKVLGVWEMMKNARVAPFYSMKVWDSLGTGSIDFAPPSRDSELGYIIEHHIIQGAFYEKLKQIDNIDLIAPETIESIQFDGENLVTVNTRNGTFQTRLLVGADGANSSVRKFANIPAVGYSYNQQAIVATVKHEKPNTTAWQRFLPTGPVALLPLFDNYSSIVWSTNPNHASALLKLTAPEFLYQLEYAFNHTSNSITNNPLWNGGVMKDFVGMAKNLTNQIAEVVEILAQKKDEPPSIPPILEIVGKRAAFPLRIAQATSYVRPRLALIGDACHTIHPMAGQGVNLGFGDAIALLNNIMLSIESGSDIGNLIMLQQYEHERFLENTKMLAGVDGIKKIFDYTAFPLVMARNAGLYMVDKFFPLKDFLRDQALGNSDNLKKIGNIAALQEN